MIAFLRSYAWAIVSGVLMAWAFPTFHWFPLAWLALVPLFVRAARQTPREAAAQFFVGGWVFYAIVLQWLTANIFWAGGWAIVSHLGLSVVLALFWAALGAIWSGLNARWPDYRTILLVTGCWISMEWIQGRLFTGFCWAALGFSQGPDVWFAQVASLVGVIGLSGVLAAVNLGLAQAILVRQARWKLFAIAAGLAALVHLVGLSLYGADQRDTSDYTVGMYQSHYPQHMKWDPDFQEEMLEMAMVQSHAVLDAEPAQLLVWPEALVMDDFRSPRTLEQLQSFTAATGTPLFTGAVRRDVETGDAYNSSALIRPDGTYDYYDKVHLAPMGEYIPFEKYLSFVRGFGANGGMTPGKEQVVLEANGRKFGPLICFEVLFAPQASRCRQLGADFLVVVTNLAWFGQSNILAQELEIARFRAIENRLPLVQCANSGVSAIIDPYGRIAVIDGFIGRQGYVVWKKDRPPSPADAMLQRRAAAMPLAPAGHMLIPGSVDWFGRIVPVLSLLGLLWWAAVARMTRRRETAE